MLERSTTLSAAAATGRTQMIIAREALAAGFDLSLTDASELTCAVVRLAIGHAARGV